MSTLSCSAFQVFFTRLVSLFQVVEQNVVLKPFAERCFAMPVLERGLVLFDLNTNKPTQTLSDAITTF